MIVQRIQINDNLSDTDNFPSYLYTYLLQPMSYAVREFHTYNALLMSQLHY